MGGAEPIIIKGRQLLDQGEYLSATEILNKLIYVEVHNQEAKDLLADVYEQIGYQEESPSVRNSFLAAAYVLGNGFPSGVTAEPINPDTVRALSTDLVLDVLDFLGIRLDSDKAKDMHFMINLFTPDNDEKFAIEMSNSTLTNIKGFVSDQADLNHHRQLHRSGKCAVRIVGLPGTCRSRQGETGGQCQEL
jgi:alkyl sulfatase BDS1-like metallo-beta-lactamase superfamily hydrolase